MKTLRKIYNFLKKQIIEVLENRLEKKSLKKQYRESRGYLN